MHCEIEENFKGRSMSTYALTRVIRKRKMFLQEDYYELLFRRIFPLTMQYKDRPTEVGELKDGVLENAIWKKL